MAEESLKIKPGIDQTKTPTLNEVGFSQSQLIRFVYDDAQGALVQKLGGWTKYFFGTLPAIVRALWAWVDQGLTKRLAFGTENVGGVSKLGTISSGAVQYITPSSGYSNIYPVISSTFGSNVLTITDTVTTSITQYDSVFIQTQISVGGIVLFGLYQTYNPSLSSTLYSIYSSDVLGNSVPASLTSSATSFTGSISGTALTVSSVSSGAVQIGQTLSGANILPGTIIVSGSGTSWVVNTTQTVSSTPIIGNPACVPAITTSSGFNTVTVTLPNHGYSAGDTFPVLVSSTIGGITFYGNYTVQTVPNSYSFTIYGPNTASSSTTAYINGGLARFLYSFGVGGNPAAAGYGGPNGYGVGGYGTGVGASPSLGSPITALDWSLDNWGQILISSPVSGQTTTIASFTGSVSGTTLTASAVTGAIATGQYLTGGTATPGTVILSQLSGTAGGAGTYSVSVSQTATCTGSMATNTAFQPLYQWDPSSGALQATAIPQGPVVNDGFFVAMPQRQIVTWGTSFTGVQDPLLMRWCDVNDFTTWVGQATNQAGSYRIPKGSAIISGMQGPQQGLVWTDIGLWSMQYVGQPYVYSFNEIGTKCGLIGRKAAATIGGVVYWMGPSSFYSLTSNGVQPIPCPVWDVVFQNLDTSNLYKIRAAVNSRFGEIAWYYPTTTSGGEVSNYVKYNVNLNVWDFGSLARTAWIDQSVLGPPIGADPNTLLLYQHETSNDADGAALVNSVTTGYAAISNGDYKTFIDQVRPDMKWGTYGGPQLATVNLTFKATDYPGGPITTYGPFQINQSTQFITPRIRGRLVSFEVGSSDVGSFWRMGNIRYRGQPDGKY